MELQNISDEALRDRISAFVHPSSVPPITNSTRSLLKSKLSIYEEGQERFQPGNKRSSSSTPPITMSFKCAKNTKLEKKGKISAIGSIKHNGITHTTESEAEVLGCNITSSVMDDEEMKSLELEVVHDGIKKTSESTTSDLAPMDHKREPFQTFVFFDIEATGLNSTSYKPRITEMSFIAINHKDFLHIRCLPQSSIESQSSSLSDQNGPTFNLPRVINKLTVCINPLKLIMPDVSDLTGLDNYNLEGMRPFSVETVKLINNFLESLPQPACLVAHNGIRYDYPMLNAEVQKVVLGNSTVISEYKTLLNIPCIDSLPALREICKEESNHTTHQMESENTFFPQMPEIEVNSTKEEVQAHVEILEETQCPSVTSTPIKSDNKSNYLIPNTPVKEGDAVLYNSPLNKNTLILSPSTPDFSSTLIKHPKVECNFDNEIVLTSRAPGIVLRADHDIENIMSQAALELQEEAFITPDKPDQVNSDNPPPPPRHSRGGKKRVVTPTNLSEVAKARKKLDFSSVESCLKNKPPSFSLPKLYHHWFGRMPEQSHGAEADCLTLMKVCAFKGENFVKYANLNTTTLFLL